MWLVAGLGNPGPQYAGTRHNVGFLVAEVLARRDAQARFRPVGLSLVSQAQVAGHDLVLVCPQTFMNRSGAALVEAVETCAIPLSRLVVVHDDVDLPYGVLRLKSGGGHRGLRSIVEDLGSADFFRVRIGIGRPEAGALTNYVLGPWDPAQAQALPALLHCAADATLGLISQGLLLAANRWNQRPDPAQTTVPETREETVPEGCRGTQLGEEETAGRPGGDPEEG